MGKEKTTGADLWHDRQSDWLIQPDNPTGGAVNILFRAILKLFNIQLASFLEY